MIRRSHLLPVLVLLLALVAPAIAVAGPPSPGGAMLTIHSRFCPEAYEGSDVFADCHDTVGSYDLVFALTRSGSPSPMSMPLNDEGNIDMLNLPVGAYTLTSNVNDDLIYGSLYCSVTDHPDILWPVQRLGDNRFRFVVGEGDDILCDWYSTPYEGARDVSAQVEIHSRTCPVNYTGDDIFADCHGTIGSVYTGFGLEGPDRRYGGIFENGNVAFTWLPYGDYVLFNDISTEHSRAVVYCSQRDDASALQRYDVYDSDYGGQQIDLPLHNGDDLICDWYTLPDAHFYDPTFPFPIYVYTCDTDPGVLSPEIGWAPDDCWMQEDARVTVKLTEENRVLGSCLTTVDGVCHVMTPGNVRVTVTISLGTLPAGYVPRENPVTTVVITEFAGAVFVLLPD